MKRILMMLALAAFLVAALSVSALSAFAASDAECTNNGCKQDKKSGPTTPAESTQANDPFTQTQETSQQNSTNSPNPNKLTVGPTCNYTPGGKLIENGKQASDPGCPATATA